MRVIGLDVHRSFAQVAELEDGVLRQCGRVDLVRDKVLAFARTLRADDEVVLEATGNTMAIVRLLKPHVGRVVVANPLQVRVIAEAKAKTDRIKRHPEPIQGRHREPSHLRYCDAPAGAGAGVALISPERRFSRSR